MAPLHVGDAIVPWLTDRRAVTFPGFAVVWLAVAEATNSPIDRVLRPLRQWRRERVLPGMPSTLHAHLIAIRIEKIVTCDVTLHELPSWTASSVVPSRISGEDHPGTVRRRGTQSDWQMRIE
jgi:hypothetical protein